MAKKGVEYFPLDCNLDDKFEVLEAFFGIEGFAILVKLYQKIYGGEGYFTFWNDDIAMIFAKKNSIDGSLVKDVVDKAIELDLFSKEKFDKFSILTSKGIQQRFLVITRRRKSFSMIEDYCVKDMSEDDFSSDEKNDVDGIYSKNDDIYLENDDISLKNDNIFEQSKVKESKAKKSKVNKSKENISAGAKPISIKKTYGNYSHVKLSDDEFLMLSNELGDDFTNKCIEHLDKYMETSGKFYNNCFIPIKDWVIDAVNKDLLKTKAPPMPKNKFVNYDQRQWDFDELKKLEREYAKNRLGDFKIN